VVKARLRFAAGAAQVVISNRVICESRDENRDGSLNVVLAAPNLTWLASVTVCFADLATALEPPELRDPVRDLVRGNHKPIL